MNTAARKLSDQAMARSDNHQHHVSIDNFVSRPRPRERGEFDSIEDTITENADSRVFLGVHWQFDADRGVASGKSIAEIVAQRAYGG